ncbi:MAG: DUF58 domain-containing protein [Actinomycetota bacterium]|nr:DUF58 domain-containing protein [Actinomycetota bacterium]
MSVVLACLAAAFFGIARSTGSGWVTVLVCGVVGCLIAGAVVPLWSVRRAAVAVTVPRDATVDQPAVATMALTSGAGLRMRLVNPPGDWVSAQAPTSGDVLVCPARRGVLDTVTVEVTSAAPLGLLWWRRTLLVGLDSALEVGPRRLAASLDDLSWSGDAGLADALEGRAGQDTVRSVRPYLPGDAARLVHWPATARWGDVMVREMEDPELPRLAVIADLRLGGRRGEDAASRAAGLADAALVQGIPVWLLTAERDGGVCAEVTSTRQVGRRLARAVAGDPPEGPLPSGSVVVRVDR